MNNLQPYEKHLADRLQELPVPDKETGWKEMRKLLDRDLPEGGAAWSGNRKWWWMGITVAIIISGLWVSQQLSERKAQQANQLPGFRSPEKKISKDDAPSKNVEDVNRNSSTSNISDDIKSVNQKIVDKGNKNEDVDTAQGVVLPFSSTSKTESTSTSNRGVQKRNVVNGNTVTEADFNKNEKQHLKGKSDFAGANEVVVTSSANGGIRQSSTANHDLNPPTSANAAEMNSHTIKSADQLTMISSSIQPLQSTDLMFKDPAGELDIISPSIAVLKAEPGKTDKLFVKEMRKKSIKEDDRKMSGKSMRGVGSERDHDLNFAAGLALPQSFPIGSQQSPSYGVNASSSRASDYLPVPFFQYHVNPRLFLQTEFQFQSPQYTDRLLVYQSQNAVSATGMLEKNIFIEKLYYFNIPFNIYFSPARNFFLGTGLQFSSLLSGVATYQSNTYNGGSLQNSYSRVQGFKDDSVAAKLAPTEWRYQLDANYYVKRFTLGARYNQALKQFADFQPSAALPNTQGRNQSFLIYLRYNIWEERKKGIYSGD